MIKKLELSSSQHQGWDKYCDERSILEARMAAAEKRFLMDCLMELGGKLTEPWQYDAPTRIFYMEVKEDAERNDEGSVARLVPQEIRR